MAVEPFNAQQAVAHQNKWAEYLQIPVNATNSIGMKLRLIPPGEFLMGTTKEEVAKHFFKGMGNRQIANRRMTVNSVSVRRRHTVS